MFFFLPGQKKHKTGGRDSPLTKSREQPRKLGASSGPNLDSLRATEKK